MATRCPVCNGENAYVGLGTVECPNANCVKFSQRQYDDVFGKTPPAMDYETFVATIEQLLPNMIRLPSEGAPETYFSVPGIARSRAYVFSGDEYTAYFAALTVLRDKFGAPGTVFNSSVRWYVPGACARGVNLDLMLDSSNYNVGIMEIEP